MTTKNDITGDLIKSKSPSKNYHDNYDRIFRKNKELKNDETINDINISSTNNYSGRRTDSHT